MPRPATLGLAAVERKVGGRYGLHIRLRVHSSQTNPFSCAQNLKGAEERWGVTRQSRYKQTIRRKRRSAAICRALTVDSLQITERFKRDWVVSKSTVDSCGVSALVERSQLLLHAVL